MNGVMQVGAALGDGRLRAALAQDLGKQVAERRRVVDASGREIKALEAAHAPFPRLIGPTES